MPTSGDLKSGDCLFFLYPPPPKNWPTPQWEWLRSLYEVHTIKIRNHRFDTRINLCPWLNTCKNAPETVLRITNIQVLAESRLNLNNSSYNKTVFILCNFEFLEKYSYEETKKGFGKRWKTGRMLASPQTSFGVRLSRIEPQRTSAGRLAGCKIFAKQERECRIRTPRSRNWARGTAKKKHGRWQVNISLKLLLTHLLGSNPYFGL